MERGPVSVWLSRQIKRIHRVGVPFDVSFFLVGENGGLYGIIRTMILPSKPISLGVLPLSLS